MPHQYSPNEIAFIVGEMAHFVLHSNMPDGIDNQHWRKVSEKERDIEEIVMNEEGKIHLFHFRKP